MTANRLRGTLKLWLTLEPGRRFLVDRMDGISGDSSGSEDDPVDDPVEPDLGLAVAEAADGLVNSPGSPNGVVGVSTARLDGGGGAETILKLNPSHPASYLLSPAIKKFLPDKMQSLIFFT